MWIVSQYAAVAGRSRVIVGDLIRASFAAESAMLPFRRYPLLTLSPYEDRRTFDVTFNYVSFHVIDDLLRSRRLESLGFSLGSEPTNLPIAATVYVYPGSEQIDLMLDYQKEEFGEEQITAMAGYYMAAMDALVAEPASSYETADILGQGVSGWKRGRALRASAGARLLTGRDAGRAFA